MFILELLVCRLFFVYLSFFCFISAQTLREGGVHRLQAWPSQPVREHGAAENRGSGESQGRRLVSGQEVCLRLQGQEVSRGVPSLGGLHSKSFSLETPYHFIVPLYVLVFEH